MKTILDVHSLKGKVELYVIWNQALQHAHLSISRRPAQVAWTSCVDVQGRRP